VPTALQKLPKTQTKLSGIIPAGGSLDLDVIPNAEFSTAKYVIKLFNQAESKTKTMALVAVKFSGTVNDTIYASLGDSLAVTVKVEQGATDTALRMANAEVFEVSTSVVKTLL